MMRILGNKVRKRDDFGTSSTCRDIKRMVWCDGGYILGILILLYLLLW